MDNLLNDLITRLNYFGEAFWSFSTVMFTQVCVLVAILLLVDMFLRHKIRAVFRYWLWSLVLLKLVLPVTLYSPASAAYWLTDYISLSSTVDPTLAVEPSILKGPMVNETLGPETEISVPNPAKMPVVLDGPSHFKPVSDTLPTTDFKSDAGVVPVAHVAIADTRKTVPAALQKLNPAAMLFMLWLSIATIMSIFVIRRTLRVRQLTRQAVDAPDDLVILMKACCKLIGLKQNIVKLKISDDMGSPAICGLWKPTILVPRHLLSQLDSEQFRQVFIHELAHWKRYDLHVSCVQTLLLIFYFYNPMVWIANLLIRRLREQAVDETVLATLDVQSQQYSTTLLDIAALTRIPDEVSLQLIGIIEPRKPLAQRIRRILSWPVPRSAKLGTLGLFAIILTGVVLLPMSGVDQSQAAEEPEITRDLKPDKPEKETVQNSDQKIEPKAQPKPASKAILSGRIVDELGSPVTDAEIHISVYPSGRSIRTKTDDDGYYEFEEIDKPGEHRYTIKSKRCVGINLGNNLTRVLLTDETNTVRDFTLQRAAQLRIETVDEDGKPVSGVRLYYKSMAETRFSSSPDPVHTGTTGKVTFGVKASDDKWLIGTSSKDYGYEKLVVLVNDVDKITSRKIVLRKGVSITGHVLCSDWKPPAGWRITALPIWWNFGGHSSGPKVGFDGEFTLPHVVPDKYNVTISVPTGELITTSLYVLKSTDITAIPQPLSLKLDYLSPSSMVDFSGRIHITGGGKLGKGFYLSARTEDGNFIGSRTYVRPGESKFIIEAIQPGKYTISANSSEFESIEIKGVTVPSNDFKLELAMRRELKLRGIVMQDDTSQPVTKYRVRVIKHRTLRGPGYVQDGSWVEVDNTKGSYELDVTSPGIYTVQVIAEGYAQARSEQINTDENQGKAVQIKLTKGVSLSGMVVDNKGQPISGASVIPLSTANGTMVRQLNAFTTKEGAVETASGKFTFKHLAPGSETFKVIHPDYTFAIVKDIKIDPQSNSDLTIALKRGGTVQGIVRDANGKPEPNVTLFFHESNTYSGFGDEAGLFATVVTDEKGRYSVSHLPEQLCHVYRSNHWEVDGVVRQSVLPENEKTSTLNFGGQSNLTGQLKVNGVPLANTRIVLSGKNSSFGILKAYAHTSNDGSFVFKGVGPAKRYLYYAAPGKRNDWVLVNSFQLTADDQDLGTIEHATGQLTVTCPPEAADGIDQLRMILESYDPTWASGPRLGGSAPRQGNNAPFVFNQVPPGEYELSAYRTNHPTVRQRIKITRDNLNPTIEMPLPLGKATLQGKMDKAIFGSSGGSYLRLWSQDHRLLTIVVRDAEGNYKAENIPAGNYYLTDKHIRNSSGLIKITLKENEVKTLNLTPDNLKISSGNLGFRKFVILTPNRVPIPGCDIQLQSATGIISHHSQHSEWQTFGGDPGTYDLTVTYPGFQTHHGKAQLLLPDADGRSPEDRTLVIELQPMGQ